MTLVIGDVSGKGLSSAMYMACVRSMLHAHIEDGLSVAALMLSLAQHTRSTFRTDHFLTLFLGSLDNRTGVLTYSNAGHLPPVIVRPGGEVVELEVTAPALNLAPWSAYDPLEHRLDPGDLLFLYTDGLIEAENPHAEQFGRERLLACLCGHREQDLRSLRRRLLAEIDAFAGDCRPSDDRTLVLLRREKASARIP
ncbi:MAG: serine/threonine-protein phosphatase [Planctomycetes bacterium]|nr:serine/threonine-protein phosphatase [Planctomycetota bacterium]